MDPSRKIPSNMKSLSTKMLQIPWQMRGSNSKMLQYRWNGSFQRQNAANCREDGQDSRPKKNTQTENNNSQNNPDPLYNMILYIYIIYIIHVLHQTYNICQYIHYTTLHYTTLHYPTLHYTTLQYSTLHYITYIHTYIHIYIWYSYSDVYTTYDIYI